MEDMEIDDSVNKSLMNQGDVNRNTQRHKQEMVCLWIFCSVLLAGNVGQFIFYRIQCPASLDVKQVNYSRTQNNDSSTNCSSLEREKDQLQQSLDSLNKSKNLMETNYRSLQNGKEQLQTKFNDLIKKMEELQTNGSSLVTDRDQIQKNLNKMTEKVKGLSCPTDWTKFNLSCYFISTAKKNWTESRQACMDEGADLVILESHEEQVFVNGLMNVNLNAWIGLTDILEEGVWTWLDGTTVTTTFWSVGQPNSYEGNQDCGELVQSDSGGVWNDDGCFAVQSWICEK